MTDEQRVDSDRAPATADEAERPVEGDGGPGLTEPDLTASPDLAGLEVMQKEIEELNDRHLRLMAEFDNYRKRVDRERTDLRLRAQAELVGRLLDAVDDLHRLVAVEGASTSVDALLEGARLVDKKLQQTLESEGLETLEPTGEIFDPATMEALMTVPAEHPEEDEVVADVFQKGYRFKDVLVRPARVRVKKYD